MDTGNDHSKVPLTPDTTGKNSPKAPKGAFQQIRDAEKKAGKAKKKGN